MTREETELAERMYDDLKPKMLKRYGSEAAFHRQFYIKKINPNAGETTLKRYVDRVMKSKKTSPEKIAGWKCFFELEQYKCGEKVQTDADSKAGWQLRLQVKSRITGKPGRPIGTPEATLSSTYELFGEYRKISGEHGPDCTVFDELAESYIDGPLRRFNTKWHPRKSIEGDDLVAFEEDLLLLQNESSEFCNQLEQLY
ncbi:hypothetical protein [Endozoicomonas euniceicola]|uniref:Transposase n=1 Tax=Endozoicomonas euniceicola TaxID=1234143 RepID=A0ABY6GTU3_9GAMM|nr:hypothetical protein [Endozoicomonas euniceicola]UYM15463.1 hypothetical protein NX720_21845 [Endozoicomonas euniceicola]